MEQTAIRGDAKYKAHNDKASYDIEFIRLTVKHKVDFSSTKFFRFLNVIGIRKIFSGTNIEFVQIKDNLVSKIALAEIKSMIIDYVKSLEQEELTDYIYNRTTLFISGFLNVVETVELKIPKDSKHEAFFYFRNGVVKVTAAKIFPPLPYSKFKRLIWKDHIINCDFDINIDADKDESVYIFDDISVKDSTENIAEEIPEPTKKIETLF